MEKKHYALPNHIPLSGSVCEAVSIPAASIFPSTGYTCSICNDRFTDGKIFKNHGICKGCIQFIQTSKSEL